MRGDCVFRKNKYVVERKIHDSYFLIDISQNYFDDKCILYEINEIGVFIWDEIEKCKDIHDLVIKLIASIFDEVKYDDIYCDIDEFVNALCKVGFLEIDYGRN